MANTRAAARESTLKRKRSVTITQSCNASADITTPTYQNTSAATFEDVDTVSDLECDGDISCDDDGEADTFFSDEEDIQSPHYTDDAVQLKCDNNHDNNSTELAEANGVMPVIGLQRPDKKKVCVKARGRVRLDDSGKLEWFDPMTNEWRPAVYHKDIRRDLIRDAAKLGKYKHSMAQGKHELDVTAFHPAFRNNGSRRENWPKILFQYLPSSSDLQHIKPEYWQYHDGRIVVDLNNDAMYDYPELPVTLARKADAWLLLALMRMNSTISIQDLRGRMMDDMNPNRADPMGRNRISMNMQRFRKFACCLTWNSIRAVDVQRDYLDKKLPRRCIRENSTESFRMLYPHEAAELDLVDAGKFLHRTRARERDLSKAKSDAIYKRKLKVYNEQKKKFDRMYPDGASKDYDTEDEEYHAQQANLPSTMQELHKEDANPIEEPTDEIKAEPDITPVKRRKTKKQKTENSIHILPDEPSQASSPVNEETYATCRRLHRNYAGFFTTAPNSVTDAQLLYDLLLPTREHFKTCTSFYPPETNGDDCYKCQHRDIQNALVKWHAEQTNLHDAPVVRLIGISYIDEDLVWWNNKWHTDWFGSPLEGTKVLGRKQTDGTWKWW